MNIRLCNFNIKSTQQPVLVPGSKSESNRLLILKAWYPSIKIYNLSTAVDTVKLERALESFPNDIVDVHHAGTAMRFLTAFFAARENCKVTLTGSARMQERPIGVLVSALRELGAEIDYAKEQGFPPLRIRGKKLSGGTLTLDPSVSSQYVSALILIAPQLDNGLELRFKKKPTSMPYIEMTAQLLKDMGVACHVDQLGVTISPFHGDLKAKEFEVCSDWSSASYYFSAAALSPVGTKIVLTNFVSNNLQGDAGVMQIYQLFGVSATQSKGELTIEKISDILPSQVELDLNETPDLAQTIAISCLGLKIPCKLTGLHTLKIKETDRLLALKTEMEKCGAIVKISDNTLILKSMGDCPEDVVIDTYNDHRMAMSFAPLSILNSIVIKDAKVVEKSYPDFWEDFKKIGLNWEVF